MDQSRTFTAKDPRVKHLGGAGISVDGLNVQDSGTIKCEIFFLQKGASGLAQMKANLTARIHVTCE